MSGYFDIDGLTKRALAKKDDFLRGLYGHPPDNPIKSRQIEAALGVNGSEVRALVSHLRIAGEPIGSDTRRGYYWCSQAEHLDETKAHIKSRMRALTEVSRGLELAEARLRCGQSSQGKLL